MTPSRGAGGPECRAGGPRVAGSSGLFHMKTELAELPFLTAVRLKEDRDLF